MTIDLTAILIVLLRDPAIANALRDALGSANGDELLDRKKFEQLYPIKWRTLTDAAKRGEVVLAYVGRKPLIARRNVDTWIARRPAPKLVAANDAGDTMSNDERYAARLAAESRP